MNKKKNILICPLDWGLGHATRCVPLIKQFLKEGNHVIIGADKNPLIFLQQEFPELESIVIPGFDVEYDEKGSTLKLFYKSVKFYNFIKKEKQFIDRIIEERDIDMIVSDNRYGLYSDKVRSIIITHQIYPKTPFGEKLLHNKIQKLLSNFDEVWIPDHEGENNLSGDLSHLKPFEQKHQFIGPLSRFENPVEQAKMEYDVCAIISGPETQRTVFEKLILEQLSINDLKAVLVRGLPAGKSQITNHNNQIEIYNHLPTQKLQELLLKSKLVVCRSGYSSIMDLSVLGRKALLVPTPGQTEQEYLAKYHLKQGAFYTQKQNELDLLRGIQRVE